jgi:hypothetical protein
MIGLQFGAPTSKSLRRRFTALEKMRPAIFSQLMVVPLFHRHRILTQVAADNVNIVKLLPALICGQEEIDYFVAALDDVLKDAHDGSGLFFEFGRTMAKGALRRAGTRRPDAPYTPPDDRPPSVGQANGNGSTVSDNGTHDAAHDTTSPLDSPIGRTNGLGAPSTLASDLAEYRSGT